LLGEKKGSCSQAKRVLLKKTADKHIGMRGVPLLPINLEEKKGTVLRKEGEGLLEKVTCLRKGKCDFYSSGGKEETSYRAERRERRERRDGAAF